MPGGQSIARRTAEDEAVLSAFNEIMEVLGELPSNALAPVNAAGRKSLLLVLRLVYHTGGRDALAQWKGGGSC